MRAFVPVCFVVATLTAGCQVDNPHLRMLRILEARGQEVKRLNQQANDQTLSASERAEAICTLFAKYVELGKSSQEIHEVLTDTRWLDEASIRPMLVISGYAPLGSDLQNPTYCIDLCSRGELPSSHTIYVRLTGESIRGKLSHDGVPFLKGQSPPDDDVRLKAFAIVRRTDTDIKQVFLKDD